LTCVILFEKTRDKKVLRTNSPPLEGIDGQSQGERIHGQVNHFRLPRFGSWRDPSAFVIPHLPPFPSNSPGYSARSASGRKGSSGTQRLAFAGGWFLARRIRLRVSSGRAGAPRSRRAPTPSGFGEYEQILPERLRGARIERSMSSLRRRREFFQFTKSEIAQFHLALEPDGLLSLRASTSSTFRSPARLSLFRMPSTRFRSVALKYTITFMLRCASLAFS
jgi:hypothetical protein